MSDSNSNNIKTGWVLAILIGIILLVVGFYFLNFNSHILKDISWSSISQNLSKDTGKWGTFGDYVGGILNPVIAFFAFYLIKKTYELQKKELEATRKLLKNSTDAQKSQIELAAITSLLNSLLMKVDMLNAAQINLQENVDKNNLIMSKSNEQEKTMIYNQSQTLFQCISENDKKIKKYNDEIARLEEQINNILKAL